MMNLQEFAEKLLENVTKQVASDVEVKLCTVLKPNDVKSLGLLMRKAGQQTGIRFCVEKLYERYLNNHCEDGLSGIVHQLVAALGENEKIAEDLVEQITMDIFDLERVKNRIYLKLINTEWSKYLLKTMPHIPYLDLSAVFYLYNSAGSILIHEELMRIWNTTPHELYEIALDNMVKQQPAKFFSVQEYLEEHGTLTLEKMNQAEEVDTSLYTLTNALEWNGASALLYPDVLETYANQYGCDWLIIPSSVHEVLLRPYCSEAEIENARSAISDVNASLLSPDEVLSDHPYLYRRDKKELICM